MELMTEREDREDEDEEMVTEKVEADARSVKCGKSRPMQSRGILDTREDR